MEGLSTQVMAAIATAWNKPVSSNPRGEQTEGSAPVYQYQGSKLTPGLPDPSDWRPQYPTFYQDFSDRDGAQGEFYPYQDYRERNFDDRGSWYNGNNRYNRGGYQHDRFGRGYSNQDQVRGYRPRRYNDQGFWNN